MGPAVTDLTPHHSTVTTQALARYCLFYLNYSTSYTCALTGKTSIQQVLLTIYLKQTFYLEQL